MLEPHRAQFLLSLWVMDCNVFLFLIENIYNRHIGIYVNEKVDLPQVKVHQKSYKNRTLKLLEFKKWSKNAIKGSAQEYQAAQCNINKKSQAII